MTLGRIVDGLALRGHRITVIRPRQRHESPRFSVTQRLACRQVRLPGVPMPGYPQLRVGLPAGRRLRQLWTLNRPDLVHVATEGPLGASAISTARRLGIPVTSSFHTNFDQYTRDYRLGWLHPIVAAWLRYVHNRTLRTFVPTRDLFQRLAQADYQNLRILSRGVDTALFHPARRDQTLRARWGAGPDDPVVLHVGRLAAEKNYPLLFRAFDVFRRHEPRAKLVIVGDGPLLSACQKQRPDAVFTGFYTGVNLARHYASGDVYLHGRPSAMSSPRRWPAGWPSAPSTTPPPTNLSATGRTAWSHPPGMKPPSSPTRSASRVSPTCAPASAPPPPPPSPPFRGTP